MQPEPLIRALEASPLLLPDPPVAPLAWLYLPGEYEAGVLDRLVREGRAASRFVEFADNYRKPSRHLAVRLTAGSARRLYSRDGVRARTRGTRLVELGDGWWELSAPAAHGAEVDIVGSEHDAPGVAVDPSTIGDWRVSLGDDRWQQPHVRAGGLTPAHLAGEPIIPVVAEQIDTELWRLPVPVLGRLVIDSRDRPEVVTGESIPELDSPAEQELRFDVERRPDGLWQTVHEICGLWVRVTGATPRAVHVDARSRPHERRGAFACSEERLTAIWQASALTLHLCSQGLVIDGLKRDRMPWSGDQALNTVSNAFAFGDGQLVRDGLVALGRPTHGYINGIADYSLWWVVNAAQYVRHFGDTGFAVEYATHLDRFLADLSRDAGDDGVLRPSDRPDGFVGAAAGSVFIDWGYELPTDGPSGALQVLWYWTLRSGAALLESAGHPSAARWHDLAQTVAGMLHSRAWDAEHRRWRTAIDVVDARSSAHPNLLAVLSGLDADPGVAVLDAIRDGDVGTPFMRGFALSALARGGRGAEAVAEIRERWGEMLDVGPGTMWEEFVGDEPYAMYGRPFAKSLCHAWSSGPASLLPELLLGLAPTSDGWRTFRVEPRLGDLVWASASVPTEFGDIAVSATRGSLAVDIPAGVTLEHDGRMTAGPARLELT